MIDVLACSWLSLVSVLGADVIVLREDRGEQTGTVVASDDSSLRIETVDGDRRQIPWDLVRSIRFESPESRPATIDDRLERATEIWRARSRLQRGDADLAEPLFEQLFQASPSRRGETDLIIAEGLLRCRLNRGALGEAMIPALETMRLRRLGVETDRYDSLVPIHDEASDLCIYLPPAWPHASQGSRISRQLEEWDAGGDLELARLAKAYQLLVEHPTGLIDQGDLPQADDEGEEASSTHAGVRLIELIAASRSSDLKERRAARATIQQRITRRDDWRLPWLHYSKGVSLLLEDGDGLRREGLVELAWIPARHGTEHPYLAGTAMAIMAGELARQGDVESARRLDTELRKRFPNHPTCRTDAIPMLDGSQEE